MGGIIGERRWARAFGAAERERGGGGIDGKQAGIQLYSQPEGEHGKIQICGTHPSTANEGKGETVQGEKSETAGSGNEEWLECSIDWESWALLLRFVRGKD